MRAREAPEVQHMATCNHTHMYECEGAGGLASIVATSSSSEMSHTLCVCMCERERKSARA